MTKIFGISGLCPVTVSRSKYDSIKKAVLDHFENWYDEFNFSFKVRTRRNNKAFPINSMQMDMELGHELLVAHEAEGLHVDVHAPSVMLDVEIERPCLYLFQDYSRSWRTSSWNKRKGSFFTFWWYRQPGCYIHDWQAWR